MGVKDSTLLSVEKLNAWNTFCKSFQNNNNIEAIITLQDLRKLTKNKKDKQFDFKPVINDSIRSNDELEQLKKTLFLDFPFYDDILYNKDSKAIRSIVYLKKSHLLL